MELPVEGFPISEAAVGEWFRRHHGREPAAGELGAILIAMTDREATPPREGPVAEEAGWRNEPSAPPATRR